MKITYYSFFTALFFMMLMTMQAAAQLPEAVPAPSPQMQIVRPKEELLVKPEVAAPEEAAGLRLVVTAKVKEFLKSDIVLLDNDKRYRLENILIPVYYDQLALDELNKEFLGKMVSVYTYHEEGDGSDRYGIPLVHLMREDGTWLQADLVSKGFAWAHSTEKSRKMVDALFQREAAARAAKLGFWIDPAYAIKHSSNIQNYADSFQIVEGKILYTSDKTNIFYFNFGTDWKTDFTIGLPREHEPLFRSIPHIPFKSEAWKDRIVRIRGWVTNKNGPAIELTHPEQVEFPPQPPKKN